MSLFKKKSKQTEEERKAYIAKTVTDLEFFSSQIGKKIDRLIEKGKKAKAGGFTQQLSVIKTHVKRYLAMQKQAEGMALTVGLMEDIRDMSLINNKFLNSINLVSKETMQIIDKTDFSTPITPFTRALAKIDQNSERMDAFLEHSETAMDEASLNSISDEEVDMLFDSGTPGYLLNTSRGGNNAL